MTSLEYVLVIIICLLLLAFFSGSEIAFMRLDPKDLEKDVAEGRSPSAVAARNLLRSTSKLLITILLAATVANVLGTVCAASLAVSYLGERLGIIVSTVSMTVLVLFFSEILPKAIAARSPLRVTRVVALPLYLIHHSLFLLHLVVDCMVEPLVKRILGGDVERRY